MKAYIILGTTGTGIYQIANQLTKVVGKQAGLETTDKPNFSSTTFEFPVNSPQEAKELIGKAFEWLTKQPWYFNDECMAFSTSGLLDDEGNEWYCEECDDDLDNCECPKESLKV